MYYRKFKFLCINLENGICALKNVGKYILNNSGLSIFKVSKASTMFRGIFMIIWKSIKLCYIVKNPCHQKKIKEFIEDISAAA